MRDLLELAARCETAEAQQHAIMADVYEAVLGRGGDFDRATMFLRFLGTGAFLDAAMMLVSEECRFNLNKRPFANGRPDGYHAQVWFSRYYETTGDMPNAWAATPALALCAAALRARASS